MPQGDCTQKTRALHTKAGIEKAMSDANWKAEERKVAHMFGTSRQLMKGTDEKSDIISDLFMVDAKLRKRWSVQQWYRDLKAASRKQSKIPILTIREPGKKLRLAVIDLDYLISIMKGASVLDSDSECTGGR